jgi:hypothetical protein
MRVVMRITRTLVVSLVAAAGLLNAPQPSQAGCCGLFDWLFHRNDACCPPAAYPTTYAGYGGACCNPCNTGCNTGYGVSYRPVFRSFGLFRPWTTSNVCCAPQTTYRPIFASSFYNSTACCAPACGSPCGDGCSPCGTSSYYPTTSYPGTSYPSAVSGGGNCCGSTGGYAPSTIIGGGGVSGGATVPGSVIEPTPAGEAPRTFSNEGGSQYPESTPGTGEGNGASSSGYNNGNSGTNAPIRIQDPNNRVTSAPRGWTFRQAVARPYELKPALLPVQNTAKPQAEDEGWSQSER